MTLPLALVCLGVLAFAGFVLWLRERHPQNRGADVAPLANRISAAEKKIHDLEEWRSNVALREGLRRKPEAP